MRFGGLVLVAVLVSVPGTAAGQTLEQCIALARRNAPALRVAAAGVSRADQAIREARAALSPTLRLSAGFVQNSEAQQTVFSVPGVPGSETLKLGSASALDARLVGEYTLYSGGRDAALARAADAAKAGQIHDRARADADLVLRVSQAYYRVLAAQRLEAAAREAVQSARSHRALASARVAAGAAPRLDSLRAQVDLAQRSTALVRAGEAVRIARVELEAAIGAMLDSSATLTPPGEPAGGVPGADSAMALALRRRPELKAAADALRENGLRLQAARAARRPSIGLSATAQYLGPNRDEDWWDAGTPGLRTHRLFAGLGLTMPLYDAGLTAARVAEVAADRAALEARREVAELGIRAEVEHALSDLRVAQAAWQSDTGSVATAREALRIAEAGYRGGTSTGTDVRDAEAALADSRAEEAQTLMDYWAARAALDHSTGTTPGGDSGKEH